MKYFPALIIADALEAIGEDADALVANVDGMAHRDGFGIESDRAFAVIVVEIANSIVKAGDEQPGYLMGMLVDMVDEMRKTPSAYFFPGWTLRYED